MAISLGGRSRTFAEINVTPLADVMIVLLVIAMVTVPALSRGPVRTLPMSDAARERRGPVEVGVTADGSVFLGADELSVASSGGRPTVADWKVVRKTRYSKRTWAYLSGLAAKWSKAGGVSVSPSQVAARIVEEVCRTSR